MIIPKGVNFPQFYRNAKKAGVRIHSRFNSVTTWEGRDNKVLYWVAQSGHSKETPHYLRKHFPFTESGELEANRFLLEWKERFGIKTIKQRKKREDPKILQRT